MQPIHPEPVNLVAIARQSVVDFINLDMEEKYPIEWNTDEALTACAINGDKELYRAHGSYPWCRWFKSSFRYYGVLAQLGEHLPYKQRVTGSSPVGPIYYPVLYVYGGIAQLARAHGSYPWCRWFKSSFRY